MSNDRDRTLALAGIFQAAVLTQELARRGECDDDAFTASVGSLFAFDPSSTADVYGGVAGLATGLRTMHSRMATQAEISDFEIGRYVQSLSQLAGRLSADRDRPRRIHSAIFSMVPQFEALRIDENTAPVPDVVLCAAMADIYTSTISTLSPQIIVHGEHGYLSDEEVVNRVRSSLFSGIRAAWLWHQLGGRKWHLLLHKRRHIETAGVLLAEAGLPTGL